MAVAQGSKAGAIAEYRRIDAARVAVPLPP
jgi:hypothetical protein